MAFPRLHPPAFALLLLAAGLVSCGPHGKPAKRLVLYTSGDTMFTREVLDEFQRATGIEVEVSHDTEVSRGVKFRIQIDREKGEPRADVYWNNELANTLILKKRGLLDPYKSPSAADVPDAFRDPQGYWTGFGARARIFLVNTDLVKAGEEPKSMRDFLDPRWRGKAGMARPSYGTTATHAAALFEVLGEDAAREFYAGLNANGIVLCNGNGHVMSQVAAGELAWGWTDTNDANVAVREGKPVKVVYPDQGEGQMGTLLIPHSAALVKNGPNPENARAFLDFLLTRETERKLAAGLAAQIPVRGGVEWPREAEKAFLMDISRIKTFNSRLNWDRVADRLDSTIRVLEGILK
jgi:iron(III) transport system substrate-binding protein